MAGDKTNALHISEKRTEAERQKESLYGPRDLFKKHGFDGSDTITVLPPNTRERKLPQKIGKVFDVNVIFFLNFGP
jgi:hypothetical protein